MIQKALPLLAIFAFALSEAALAQPLNPPTDCGTVLTPEGAAAVAANLDAGMYDPGFGPAGVLHIPLNFYILRRSDGTGAPPAWRITEAMEDANTAFTQAGIQFCRRFPTRYIDDDAFFDIDSRAEADLIRNSFGLPDSLNVFVVESLTLDGNGVCAISSFTWSNAQGIVIDSACLGSPTNNSTFPHEIGHYFDLLHTHETARGRECVDGSNCQSAGDQICDTPADPRLGAHNINADCDYFGTERDTCNNDLYSPDTRNILSYAPVNCRDNLTPGQAAWAAATLANLRPGLARTDCDMCQADLNGDGLANTLDVLIFLGLYAESSPSADWNADSVINSLDVLGFLNEWAAGC